MLSVGVIGTGNISRAHLHACLELPQEVQVVARADIESAKAETARTEFALDGARVYEDAASMLAAGVHGIVEKPMAPSLEECGQMPEAQRHSGELRSVIAQNRFRDDMAHLKAVLDSGRIGRTAHARIASA